jgi:hypothetical protein
MYHRMPFNQSIEEESWRRSLLVLSMPVTSVSFSRKSSEKDNSMKD